MSSSAPCLAETTAQCPARNMGHVPQEPYLHLPISAGAAHLLLQLPERRILPTGTYATAGVRPRHVGNRQRLGGALGDGGGKCESRHPHGMGANLHFPSLCTAAASTLPMPPRKRMLPGLLHLRAVITHQHGEACFPHLKQHLSWLSCVMQSPEDITQLSSMPCVPHLLPWKGSAGARAVLQNDVFLGQMSDLSFIKHCYPSLKNARVLPLALVPGTSCSQELASGKAPPEASVVLSLSYRRENTRKIFFFLGCHNSDGLTEPVHLQVDVKRGTIQVKKDF